MIVCQPTAAARELHEAFQDSRCSRSAARCLLPCIWQRSEAYLWGRSCLALIKGADVQACASLTLPGFESASGGCCDPRLSGRRPCCRLPCALQRVEPFCFIRRRSLRVCTAQAVGWALHLAETTACASRPGSTTVAETPHANRGPDKAPWSGCLCWLEGMRSSLSRGLVQCMQLNSQSCP